MTELIRKYREYVEHLIALSCGDMSNYKLDEARTEDVEGEQLHGNNCATWGKASTIIGCGFLAQISIKIA